MKIGVVFFHMSIHKNYKEEWIDKSIRSMLNQSYQDFIIYEIDYSGNNNSLISKYSPTQEHNFFSLELENHGYAMNYVIDRAFLDGCDYVFNTNMDDYYSRFRIEKQVEAFTNNIDIVSSNFYYVTEINGMDSIVKSFYVHQYEKTIEVELINKSHNIVAHPVVAFSKNFWKHNRYDPSEIPLEDLKLWQRSYSRGSKFKILEDFLLNYRLHEKQITGNNMDLSKKILLGKTTPTQISEIPSTDPTRLP